MRARPVVEALGGRWHGSYGTAHCPVHDDRSPSLSVADGDTGRLLVNCHAGCDPLAVLAALRQMGIDSPCRHESSSARPRPIIKADRRAKKLWYAAGPAAGTIAEIYLRQRAIKVPVPSVLRFHATAVHPFARTRLPALVAAVQQQDDRATAVHLTFLRYDGTGKANIARSKLTVGPLGSGVVRLAAAQARLGLAEGIEDALSAMQLFDVPCWAACGARIASVQLPPISREVVIFADNDTPGEIAARRAAKRFAREGRGTEIRCPPAGFKDWNEAAQANVRAA